MGQILVRNLDDAVIEKLKARARRENTSLEQTVRNLLTEATQPSRDDAIEQARRIREMASMSSVNSVDLIRPDRDNDEPYR